MQALNYCFDILNEKRFNRKFVSSNSFEDMYNFLIKNHNSIQKEDGLIPLHYELFCETNDINYFEKDYLISLIGGYNLEEHVIKTDIFSLKENLNKIFIELNMPRIDLWVKPVFYDKLSKWTKL